MAGVTPLMNQYLTIKESFKQELLFFQVGDFYELFFDDAKIASQHLGITLTSRNKNDPDSAPLCGIPVHALDHYLVKLVKAGFHIAICDQLEEPVPGKVVKRGVTRVFTPGTLIDEKLLSAKTSSYLLFITQEKQRTYGIFFELLTGCAHIIASFTDDTRLLEIELMRFMPDEIVIDASQAPMQKICKQLGYQCTMHHILDDLLTEQYKSFYAQCALESLKSDDAFKKTLKLFYSYMNKNQPNALLCPITYMAHNAHDYVYLDSSACKNLELITNKYDNSHANSLFDVLDCAVTPMGSRMIKKWIMFPLRNISAIHDRQAVVQKIYEKHELHNPLEKFLNSVGDVERVVGRIALERASLHDYRQLFTMLSAIKIHADILHIVSDIKIVAAIQAVSKKLIHVSDLLGRALAPAQGQEYLIKNGYYKELDEKRFLVEKGHERILAFEQEEQKKTGIASLKIRYNSMVGYYIEITKSHMDKIPPDYIRSQSLTGRERFSCMALKVLEQELSTAKYDAELIEQQLFADIKAQVKQHLIDLRSISYALAHLDALVGFARCAYLYGWTKPTIGSEGFVIVKGKHPVLDKKLRHQVIANDLILNAESLSLVITGPNMGGKSTYLRMVALISILGQIGSYVPAESAQLPIIHKIFTRIGASDNLGGGQSTFLIEMAEAAAICTHADKNSLVILDEIGRGTSTYDGLAIAQSVLEYLHLKVRAFSLCATHYHELTLLTQDHPGIKNMYAASKHINNKLLLFYTIIPGVADGSFGIEVARQAGIPEEVIVRARILHKQFIRSVNATPHIQETINFLPSKHTQHDRLYRTLDKVLGSIDLNTTTPLQAFALISELYVKYKEVNDQ